MYSETECEETALRGWSAKRYGERAGRLGGELARVLQCKDMIADGNQWRRATTLPNGAVSISQPDSFSALVHYPAGHNSKALDEWAGRRPSGVVVRHVNPLAVSWLPLVRHVAAPEIVTMLAWLGDSCEIARFARRAYALAFTPTAIVSDLIAQRFGYAHIQRLVHSSIVPMASSAR